MQCTATEDTSELLAEVNPLAYFNATWYNNQLEMEIPQLSKIYDDAGEAFTAPLSELLNKYADVFTKPGKPVARDIKHKIELLDPAKPIPYHRLQRMSEIELKEVQKHLQEYLEKGWIQPSISQYNHPILFICKKTGELRVCIDYRSLNSNTIIDSYPIPRIDDTLDRLGYAKKFSKIDLASGYHQVEMHPDHQPQDCILNQIWPF